MKKNAFILALSIGLAVLLNLPDSLALILVCICFALPFGAFIVNLSEGDSEEKEVLWTLFISALCIRTLYAAIAYRFEFWDYFASDAITYDYYGNLLAEYLRGDVQLKEISWAYNRLFGFRGSGWGMYYVIAFIYLFTGYNPIAGSFFCSMFGAAASPLVYMLAKEIYRNKRVALISSALVGFMPGFINWSSFMMKEGIIIFLLALSILMVIRLQKKFNLLYVFLLFICVAGIIPFRFYLFPMLCTAILASFLIGVKTEDTVLSVFRRVFTLLVLGVALTYAGIVQGVKSDVEKYGTLERLKEARLDQARSAASGFANEEVDVSTAEGIATILPLGFAYLMFAPLPWQVTSLRSALTQPEMVVWWLMIPFLIRGFIYSIKNKFRETLPIIIFTLILTVGYSIFQGNIGTAYRQRTQIQVFHFIFVAVGWVVTRERKENERALNALRTSRAMRRIQERQV